MLTGNVLHLNAIPWNEFNNPAFPNGTAVGISISDDHRARRASVVNGLGGIIADNECEGGVIKHLDSSPTKRDVVRSLSR